MPDRVCSRACPPLSALEQVAQGAAGAAIRRHLLDCARCRTDVEVIADNNRFLADTARLMQLAGDAGDGIAPASGEIAGFAGAVEIHRGGQGIVYRAFQPETKRYVAIKMLLHGVMSTTRQRARFEREIEIAAGLDHPNIVRLFEALPPAGGRAGYVMEFIDGETMDRWMQRPERGAGALLSAAIIRQRLALFCKICEAIGYAHERGVIHRDIKPQNILIDRAGEPHVLDFGLARTVTGDQACTVTITGEVVGTIAYAAPEQLAAAPDPDTRTDVYAMGVLLFEFLTGSHPYPVDGSMPEVIRHVTSTEPVPPRRLNPAIDSELETILQKTLSKEPERRYAFAGALLDDLRRYLVGDVIDAKRDSRGYLLKKAILRHRVTASVAGLFIAMVIAFAIVMAMQASAVAAAASELRDQLSVNRIRDGQAQAKNGNVPLAEDLLWRELVERTDGRSLAAVREADPRARSAYWALWELYARDPCVWTVAPQQPQAGRATSLATSADGAHVAVGHRDGRVELRDGRTGALRHRWQPHPRHAVAALCFDGDGARLATAGDDGGIAVWQVHDLLCVASYRTAGAGIRSMSFSSEGGALRAVDRAGGWHRWDPVTGCHSAAHSPPGFGGHAATSELAVSPIADLVGLVNGYRVEFHELSSGRSVGEISGVNPVGVEFSPDGRRCATRCTDRRIRIWELGFPDEPRQSIVLSGHRSMPLSVRFAGTASELLFAVETDGTLKCWRNLPAGQRWLPTSLQAAHGLAYSPDGSQLAVAGRATTGRVEVLDVATMQLCATLDVDSGVVASVAFVPSTERVVAADYNGDLHSWDWRSKCAAVRLAGDGNPLNCVVVGDAGRRAMVVADDGTARVWDLEAHTRQLVLGHSAPGDAAVRLPMAAWHPQRAVAATAGKDGRLRLWDLQQGAPLAVLENRGDPIRAVAFSPDGRLLASGNDSPSVCLWNFDTQQMIAELKSSVCDRFALAFHPAGTLLATAGRGPEVELWDVATATHLVTIPTDLAHVYAMQFSPDGRQLAIGGGGGSAGHAVVMVDITAGERLIAGNLEYQLQRMAAAGQQHAGLSGLRAWARAALQR